MYVRTFCRILCPMCWVDSLLWYRDSLTSAKQRIRVSYTYIHIHRFTLPYVFSIYIHTFIHQKTIHTYIHKHTIRHIYTYIQYIQTNIHKRTNIHLYIHTYIHSLFTYIHTYIHTYTRTYIYTFIHTVHTYIQPQASPFSLSFFLWSWDFEWWPTRPPPYTSCTAADTCTAISSRLTS